MPTTIRYRAAVWGIAGLASLGLVAGPTSAFADSNSATGAQAPQSSGYPFSSVEYADKLVTAYGNGDDSELDRLATRNVVDALSEHSGGHAKRWHRTAADSGQGYTWVSYTNLDTHEVMNLTVRNSTAVDGDGDAVREVDFVG
ncbi:MULTISPECIES: hypothetical protein [unclassified Brevibacterium]|uniref:hypothetical protein n=1 Tax=unclassified Brevibacterium TaxID=2614124 RepID=UPI001092F914|nr:hypothetical protein [Brevibacterium sp. S22]TGD33241.1 hypothetical protein EB835_01745 [Brevibacterium sp. S22]